MLTQQPILGTWRLVSLEGATVDGHVSYPYGQDALGYLTYGSDGRMSAIIMSADRPRFPGNDPRGGPAAEKAAAADTFIAYCGTYTLHGGRVVHHVELSLFPNWVGGDQERFYELDGDRLVIHTGPILIDGEPRTSRLVWQRA